MDTTFTLKIMMLLGGFLVGYVVAVVTTRPKEKKP
jgi:hypothetical protein